MDSIIIVGTAMTASLALWVAAWLHWTFHGGIRQFLFAKVFPERWRSGREPRELLLMSSDEIESFLALESIAPAFVNGVFGCPGCLSAHVSASGIPFVAAVYLISLETLDLRSVLLILCFAPLIWAGGAWLGQRLHVRF